jgi:phosphoglycerate dehydrogenase-like enzyme
VKRCAILDDYQNVAFTLGDWKSLPDVEVTVFNEYLPTHEKRVEALKDFDIIVAMRERTPFDAALLTALPKLKLLITTGHYNSSFDLAQAEAQGIATSGTGGVSGVTAELTWALILALTRSVYEEVRDFKAGAKWQPRVSHDVGSKRLGVIGFGRLGSRVSKVGVAFGMDVILDAEPHRGARQRGRCEARFLGRRDHVHLRLHLDPHSGQSQDPRPHWQARNRPDEADRLHRQHVARADHRRGRAGRST